MKWAVLSAIDRMKLDGCIVWNAHNTVFCSKSSRNFCVFLKNDPIRNIFKMLFRKFLSPHVLCSNFVRFGRREIGKIVRCGRRRKFGDVPCTECTGKGNDFELIPRIKMETRYPVDGRRIVC